MIERRGTSRFPLNEDVRYKLSHGKVITLGSGKTVNIGSGGVLFTTEHLLPTGRTVEVSINWPARLDGVCALKFVASGRVIWARTTAPQCASNATSSAPAHRARTERPFVPRLGVFRCLARDTRCRRFAP